MVGGNARKMRWGARALGLGGMLAGLIVVNSGSALAACHHFTVTAAPTSVAEGGKVLVTVSRDGNVAPSSIDLSTVDETAKSGTDYVAIHQAVSFTNEVQKQYTLSTIDDHLAEPSQTFRLHLSNPSGCAVNPNYVVDPDVRVTIKDNDAKPTQMPTTKPTATAAAKPTVVPVSPTPTSSAKPSPRASKTIKASTSPTSSPSQSPSRVVAAGSSSSGGAGGVLALVAGILIVAVAGGTFVLRRRRTNT
jgi:hypothetical protein